MYNSSGARLTVLEQQADGVDGVSAQEHDWIVSGGLGEGLGLPVGVEDEASALVQQLLMGRSDVGASEQQLLEQVRSGKHKARRKTSAADGNTEIEIM